MSQAKNSEHKSYGGCPASNLSFVSRSSPFNPQATKSLQLMRCSLEAPAPAVLSVKLGLRFIPQLLEPLHCRLALVTPNDAWVNAPCQPQGTQAKNAFSCQRSRSTPATDSAVCALLALLHANPTSQIYSRTYLRSEDLSAYSSLVFCTLLVACPVGDM